MCRLVEAPLFIHILTLAICPLSLGNLLCQIGVFFIFSCPPSLPPLSFSELPLFLLVPTFSLVPTLRRLLQPLSFSVIDGPHSFVYTLCLSQLLQAFITHTLHRDSVSSAFSLPKVGVAVSAIISPFISFHSILRARAQCAHHCTLLKAFCSHRYPLLLLWSPSFAPFAAITISIIFCCCCAR